MPSKRRKTRGEKTNYKKGEREKATETGVSVDLNVHMNLFQGDSDQRFVTRIWLDYEKQNECE